MKNCFVLILFLTVSFVSVAQEVTFGAKAGVNFSKFSNSSLPVNEEKENVTYSNSFNNKMGIGALVGFYANFTLNDNLSIQPELLFSQFKNNETNTSFTETFDDSDPDFPYTTTSEENSEKNVSINLISLPVMLQYNIFNGIYLTAGPQFNFLINGKVESVMQTFKKETENYEGVDDIILDEQSSIKTDNGFKNYKEIDLAFNLGLGYISDFGLNVEARYTIGGVTDLNNVELKPRIIQLSLGYDIF